MAAQGKAGEDTLIANDSDSRGLWSGRIGMAIATVVVVGLLVFVACFMIWHHIGGGAWLSAVSVKSALLLSPDRLELIVASCHGAPRVSLEEKDVDVRVKVISFSTPLARWHGLPGYRSGPSSRAAGRSDCR